MKMSVIITTYNAPEWLEKVLIGFDCQTFRDFEVVIADDGSDHRTRDLVERYRSIVSYPIVHVWHEDDGFRKCTILNKAILASSTDYLVFTDGDCIPHKKYLEVHDREKVQGYFLSGGYFKLPMHISHIITEEDIRSGRCFQLSWLHKHGLKFSFKNTKLFFNKAFTAAMHVITPTNASWNGHNASGWKADIIAVNGYNERMRYGALDRELGERLMNRGIRGKQIRYAAICVHLDHKRSYKNKADLEANRKIRERTKAEKLTWAEEGISLHQQP
ncbi:MAG TPA: glycosyl transferase family 2 [Chitinophagaceae bacterium]|nr:glycosyl transferase family 2 [Chitinophagaceae bacterium]